MRKYLTILTIICLITSLFLTSCSTEKEKMTTNSYSEQEVKLPEGVSSVFDIKQIGDKTLRMAGLDESRTVGTVWESADEGKTWTKISNFTKNIKVNKTKGITTEVAGYLSPKGQIFCVVSEWENDKDSNIKETYYIVENEENKKLTINLYKTENGENGVYNAEFTTDGSLIIQDGAGQLYKVNQKTGKVQFAFLPEHTTDIFNPFSLYEQNVYIYTDKGLKAYSIETGEEEQVNESIRDFKEIKKGGADYQRANVMVTAEEGSMVLYSMDSEGLKRYEKGQVELLLEGSKLCLASEMTSIYDFIQGGKNNLYLIAQTKNGSKLYEYR